MDPHTEGASPRSAPPIAPPIISIVGKSDSGKTTLIEKLIREFTGKGYRVATIKHDVRSFEVDKPGKDSWRHREAGAAAVVISSSTRLFLTQQLSRELSLEEIRARYLAERCDLVIAEGYRRAGAPKIEVHRSARSDELLCDPAHDELIAIVSDRAWNLPIPVFDRDDTKTTVEFIEKTFLRRASPATQ